MGLYAAHAQPPTSDQMLLLQSNRGVRRSAINEEEDTPIIGRVVEPVMRKLL